MDPLPTPSKAAGVGAFDLSTAAPPVGDFGMGFTAFSSAAPVFDLDSSGLLGAGVPVNVNTGSGLTTVTLPPGAFLQVAGSVIKGRAEAVTEGPCGPGATGCRRVLWAFGGQASLSRMAPLFSALSSSGAADPVGRICRICRRCGATSITPFHPYSPSRTANLACMPPATSFFARTISHYCP
ncbi:MAG: hypothetical protein HY904_00415 [Deltaproteobacteria bacterium]|nr:hypothetical protein [Deltaproteobacteria bacterium]